MLILLAAVAVVGSASDDPPLKALTQEAFNRQIAKLPLTRVPPQTLTCAIPLKEFRVGAGKRVDPIDPIARPSHDVNFDKIAHPAPVQACPIN